MAISHDILPVLLSELAEWLQFEGIEPIEWLVCGGVAMALQNLNTRTTQDVDVLGEWNNSTLTVICLDHFPEKVNSCIRRVIANHPELDGLKDDWINLGPSHLAKVGLPDGFARRIRSMKFGRTLTLHLLNRVDLIPLKLYAASDRFSPRQQIHFADLKLLNGSFDELDKALDWIRTLSDFEEKRPEIQAVLERLGYDDLAGYV